MCRTFQQALLIVVLLLLPTESRAQLDDLEHLFGQGVHAFHDGRLQDSLNALGQAIELGSRDPRVYYYHGIAQEAMGNSDGANLDFQLGAQLEASATGRF
jgi:Flp pilus assembly protein TadD